MDSKNSSFFSLYIDKFIELVEYDKLFYNRIVIIFV